MCHLRSLRHLLVWGAACALVAGGVPRPEDDLRPRAGDRESLERNSRNGAGKQNPPQGVVSAFGGGETKKNRPKGDDPEARHEWWRMRFGGELSTEFMGRVMREAARQRLLYPDHFRPEGYAPTVIPEGIPLPVALGASTWTNLGPTKSNKIQNGVTLTAVNSGRLRTILPDPTNADVLYVLTSGGGFWKTTNLTNANPVWTSLTDRVGSCMGGAAAFGRPVSGAYSTLYLGLGDAFDNGVGGFFVKSTDSGATWSSPIQLTGTVGPTTYTATRILDMKVDSSGATDIILVGTDVGLFRSTDAGASFALVNNANINGRLVWSLAKTSAGWLVATETLATPRLGNLQVSTDLGATWAPTTTQLPASTYSIPGTDPAIAAGRITLAVGAPGDATVYAFAAFSNTTAGGLGGLFSDIAQYDLFYSTDGGQNWTATQITRPSTGVNKAPSNPNPDQTDMDLMAGQAFYNHMILVDPTDATRNTVYLGGQLSTAYSTNAKAGGFGSTWRILTNWLPDPASGAPPGGTAGVPYAHADFHCAAFTNAGGTERLMFGNDGGLAIGTNRAGNWNTWDHSKNAGIVSHLAYAMASGPLNNCDANSVVTGLQDNGVHNRIGATGVFDQTVGGDGFGVGWSQATPSTVLSSYVENQISRATVNPADQANWNAFTTGLPGTPGNDADYYFVTPIVTPSGAADPTGNVFFTYSGPLATGGSGTARNRIFKSSAASWSVIARADGTNTTGLSTNRYVRPVSHGVGVHPTDLNRLAAACDSGIVIVSTNGGTSWTERNLTTLVPPSGGRTWVGFNASVTWVDNNILYACSESTTANSIHVAQSTDGGATWIARDTGLPDLPVVKIVVDPGDPNTLYAATWLGVYRTTDAGASWALFGSGLPQAFVSDLYVHPAGSFLRASIYGRGIWQVGPTPVYTAPAFATQPAGGSFTAGTPFTLTATISNPFPTATYQWRRNGINLANGGTEVISGATTATLTVTNPICGSAGDYTLVATNCAGSTLSATATMTSAVAPPVITTQPANLRFNAPANFTLSVAATGSGLSYQWRRNGVNLSNGAPYSGVGTSTLTFTGATSAVNGTFDCVVTASGGCSVTSNGAVVNSGTSQPPNILTQPVNASVTAPASVTFTVSSGGGRVGANRNLTFQWQRNGVNLTHGSGGYSWVNTSTGQPSTNGTTAVNANNSTGSASSTLTINPTADTMDGGFYSCRVTNGSGSASSASAKLTVLRQFTPATAVTLTPSTSFPVSRTGGSWPMTFTAAGSGSLIQGTATPAPASAYQYQFWMYIDANLGWTMMQDYSTTNTWTLPSNTQPGTYGVGVDVRTSPTVRWDKFTAINGFSVVPMRGPDSLEDAAPTGPSIPAFDGGRIVVEPDDLSLGNGPRYRATLKR